MGRYSDTLARNTMNDRELDEIGRSDIAFYSVCYLE